MKILFMGTPAFAVPSLKRLVADGHEICGVFTQPDKPKNRGHKMTFSPVKEYALSENIPVYQPVKMRDGTALSIVRELQPELTVVAAYGKILPDDILEMPKYGSINVHSSILPRYRGAAPINWAILNGETETGVSIMHMAAELDAGDVITVARTAIDENEDAGALTQRLAELGAQALSETVDAIAAGTATRTPQEHSQSTYAPMLSRELSNVDWTKSAHSIHCQIRGLLPWPAASTTLFSDAPVKLYCAEETKQSSSCAPGTIAAADKKGISVVCGDGQIMRITELQAAGGKRMSAAAYLLGHPIHAGEM